MAPQAKSHFENKMGNYFFALFVNTDRNVQKKN
jgi:hypothetical protein